jgi:hypothetical protein
VDVHCNLNFICDNLGKFLVIKIRELFGKLPAILKDDHLNGRAFMEAFEKSS